MVYKKNVYRVVFVFAYSRIAAYMRHILHRLCFNTCIIKNAEPSMQNVDERANKYKRKYFYFTLHLF